MKKIIKLIIVLMMILPFTIYAKETYSEAKVKVNGYLSRVDANHRFEDFDRYIAFPANSSYFWNNTNNGETGFVKGGLLNRDEYLITRVNNYSYLANGFGFWTLTSNGSYKYVIDYDVKSANVTSKAGTKVTEFIKPNVKVTGSGKINDPWVFSVVHRVIISINNEGAGASFSSSSDVPNTTKYVYNNESLVIPVYIKSGYTFTNITGCSGAYFSDNKINLGQVTEDKYCSFNVSN